MLSSRGATMSGLPLFFRCRRLECSRFPLSCSGTPATSVCCSSPGLRSFLRLRSAASWAPWNGRRTETGTCRHFQKPKEAATVSGAVLENKEGPTGKVWFAGGALKWP